MCDAKFVEGVAECSSMWFGGCEDNPQHIVYFGGVFWCTDAHLLGGDNVHDVVSCHDVDGVGREWAVGRHVLFPARLQGKKDEEAEVAEGVAVFIFLPTPSMKNSRRSLMVLMWSVVMVRNLVMGGRLGMLRRA